MIVDTDNLRTISQYANEIEVSPTTIYSKIKNGELKSVKIGHITLIVISDNGDKKP